MTKRYSSRVTVLCMMIGLALAACTDEHIMPADRLSPNEWQGNFAHDMISVKLKADIVDHLNAQANMLRIPTGSNELDAFLRSIGSTHVARIFPYAGKDENRQRQAELNAWYTVWLDTTATIATRALQAPDLSKVATYAEPVYTPKLEKCHYTPVSERQHTRAGRTDAPFNDPLYSRQWDFHNDGTIGNYTNDKGSYMRSAIAGADINIEPAWKETTGDPAVVVAVVDGGIDLTHPDLEESIWKNDGEIPGNGIDDDQNGYVDDVYGYNFVDDTGIVSPTRHGTHVAGTIAARNNNGRGVCSIAGGNGHQNTGVKIMCCQIFKNNPNYNPNDPDSPEEIGTGNRNLDAAAIVYGANNGAIISQNSWGFGTDYTATPQVVKEAIGYFNANAGGSRTQRPLMQGGVVIFAAGNESTHQPTYPAADENVISVAAFNPDYAASWYTNYGETVDIAAPGGTQPVDEKYPRTEGLPTSAVLSTVPRTAGSKGGYAYMQGTSMACPHVSGIAALIVSKYGSSTFTAAELRNRLLTGVKAMNYNDYVDKNHFDGMGSGYIDAVAALQNYDMETVPTTPDFVVDRSESGYGSIKVAWKSANSGADGTLHRYILYTSEQPITAANVNTKGVMVHSIAASYAKPNELFERTNMRLANHTTYYFAVKAIARNGRASNLATLSTPLTTLNNTAPTVKTDIEGNRITLAGKDVRVVYLTVTDAEGHDWSYTLRHGGTMADQRTANGIALTIDASKYMPGIYPTEVVVTDKYGAETVFHMIVEILSNRTPTLKQGAPQVIHVAKGAQLALNLNSLIDDEDIGSVTCELHTDGKLDTALHGGQLVITGKEWGESFIEISATDKHHQTGTLRIPAFVYENEGIYALYPTVTAATLYVKLGDVVNGEIAMRIRNAAGKSVMQQSFNTANIDAQKRTLLIDVSKLVPGRYTLSITNQGRIYEETFIKQ